MTGIMAAIAGSNKRLNYGTGLYNTATSAVDTSPISATAGYPTTLLTYTWIGYYRAASTATYTFGTQTLWDSSLASNNYSQGRVWIGNTAISGYNDSNYILFSNNNYSTGTYPMLAGVYYPIRLQWNYYDEYGNFNFYAGNGSFAFYVNSSATVSGAIFYNTATNGF